MLDKEMLKSSLKSLGLRAGMNVIVHSSLSRFGYVAGGADTVLDALTELLTEEGTLVMPSFNHNEPYDRGEVFDIRSTGTRNGIIPDTFWRREGVKRSMNPTHSFAAWGKNAARYTEGHQRAPAMGRGSPLSLLMEDDGYCLLLGVGYNSNTFHHFVETDLQAPCLSEKGEVYPVVRSDGTPAYAHTWGWRGGRCPIDDGALYAALMEAVHRQAEIGEATATLYKLKDGYRVIAKCLTEGYMGHPPCKACPVRPRVCSYTVQPERKD